MATSGSSSDILRLVRDFNFSQHLGKIKFSVTTAPTMMSEGVQREPQARYTFPSASQPDIIRANQKDVYYQGYILEHLERLVQNILGSRWLHSHQPLLKAFSDGAYLTLTTALGHRTLGEEYTDIFQIASTTKQKPSTLRRWGYVLTESAGWYVLIHLLWPRTRRHLQQTLDTATSQNKNGFREKCLRTFLAIIENTTSVHLALFYFLGTYYSLPKRLFQIRYMFTRRLFPGEQRPGYEFLGLLLLLQILTQSYFSLTSSTSTKDPTTSLLIQTLSPTSPQATPVGQHPVPHQITAGTLLQAPDNEIDPALVLDLVDEEVCPYIPEGSRRCPLCLDWMKDPTAAECGHLFCWDCVLRWTGESVGRGECPICRGKCGREGLLRLAG